MIRSEPSGNASHRKLILEGPRLRQSMAGSVGDYGMAEEVSDVIVNGEKSLRPAR
jgi:hypothetical protein